MEFIATMRDSVGGFMKHTETIVSAFQNDASIDEEELRGEDLLNDIVSKLQMTRQEWARAIIRDRSGRSEEG